MSESSFAAPDENKFLFHLQKLVADRRFGQLRDELCVLTPAEIAEALSQLGRDYEAVVFRILPRSLATQVFEHLPRDNQEELLQALGDEEVSSILNEMSPDDRTALLEELPAQVTRDLMDSLSLQQRKVAQKLLGYPEESIGRLMTPSYVALQASWTVAEALESIRKHGHKSETLNVLFIVDKNGYLLDVLRTRTLLLSSPETTIESLMDYRYISLQAGEDREKSIAIFSKYDRTAIPVTDSAGYLLGVITVDDVLDVAEAETTEDIQKLGGSEVLDEPYLAISFSKMFRKRSFWLIILFFGQMLTASTMALFEQQLTQAVVLAMFIPLIISSGGNSGTQAATLVIRALTISELKLADWWRVMRREVLSGLTIGLLLGTLGFSRVAFGALMFQEYGDYWLFIALIVFLAVTGVVLWGTVIGSILPFIMVRLGIDPATSSTPFVATIVDVTGLLIYFGIAVILLQGNLLA